MADLTYTVTQFRTRFPEFADIPDTDAGNAYIQALIDEGLLILKQRRWGDYWTLGMGYYVAHNLCAVRLQIKGDTTALLPTHTQRAGTVMVGYGAIKDDGTVSQSFFQGTSYGQQFLRLYRKRGMGARVR